MIKLLTFAIFAGLLVKTNQQRPSFIAKPPPSASNKPLYPLMRPGPPCYWPTHMRCWTEWFDRDDPSGTGDWENLSSLRRENPGKICPNPLGIDVRTTSGLTIAEAGNVIAYADTTVGFVCKSSDQVGTPPCHDYRVRFNCHPPFCGGGVCWTQWFNRDHPSGTGDWEHLTSLRAENPGVICDSPLYIEAVTTDTETPATSTGQIFHAYNPTEGFICRNNDQTAPGSSCKNYKVRFGYPCTS